MTESKFISTNFKIDLKENTKLHFLGTSNYESVFETQLEFAESVLKENKIYLIGCEHPSVVTLGYRLKSLDLQSTIPIIKTTRGGLATLHSIGQLVVYPILNLRYYQIGIRDYIHFLLRSSQIFLEKLDIESTLSEDAVGLYTKTGKIAFCGVQVKNGVSMHGVSINIRNDLNLFKGIESCGVVNAKLDRALDRNQDLAKYNMESLFNLWVSSSHLASCEIF